MIYLPFLKRPKLLHATITTHAWHKLVECRFCGTVSKTKDHIFCSS